METRGSRCGTADHGFDFDYSVVPKSMNSVLVKTTLMLYTTGVYGQACDYTKVLHC